ncbi:MAG: hypothetical protein ACJ8C4_13060 [Gemmataceae bacterium]
MARIRDLCKAANGQYVRNIGWKETATGYTQPKFYLGDDAAQARIIAARLEHLWEQVAARSERQQRERRSMPPMELKMPSAAAMSRGAPMMMSVQTPVCDTTLPPKPMKPIWDELTLEIAAAVRRGDASVKVSRPPKDETEDFVTLSMSVQAHWMKSSSLKCS